MSAAIHILLPKPRITDEERWIATAFDLEGDEYEWSSHSMTERGAGQVSISHSMRGSTITRHCERMK
jgi:hypothetical protein